MGGPRTRLESPALRRPSFDGIVASSVFEYLDDVPRVAAELSRVLRPEGVLLLTVPNPCNFMRKLEARLQSMRLGPGSLRRRSAEFSGSTPMPPICAFPETASPRRGGNPS